MKAPPPASCQGSTAADHQVHPASGAKEPAIGFAQPIGQLNLLSGKTREELAVIGPIAPLVPQAMLGIIAWRLAPGRRGATGAALAYKARWLAHARGAGTMWRLLVASRQFPRLQLRVSRSPVVLRSNVERSS